MRLILFLVGGVVLANIVYATFFAQVRAPETKSYTTENSATRQGLDPWMVNEKYNAPGRDRIRKSVLETLNKPWSEFCGSNGHKELIETVNYYFYQRDAQAWSYGNTYGDAARRFVLKAWQTTDDNRIQRLIGETYERGYFALGELRPYASKPLGELVTKTRVTAKPCST